MTVKELINNLSNLKEELQDKEIKMYSPNGFFIEPEIKLNLINEMDCHNKSKDNVKYVIIC